MKQRKWTTWDGSPERERKQESKKARKKKRKELWEFYGIDDHKDQEIAEREINGAQAIRFLKAIKLEFNFLENVSESDRGKKANELEMDLNRKKERKESVRRIFPDWWPKRPRNCWCEINYSKVIRFLKTSKLEKLIFWRKW